MFVPREASCLEYGDRHTEQLATRVLMRRYSRWIDSDSWRDSGLDAPSHTGADPNLGIVIQEVTAADDADSYRWANSFAVVVTALGGFATRLALAKVIFTGEIDIPLAHEAARRLDVIALWLSPIM